MGYVAIHPIPFYQTAILPNSNLPNALWSFRAIIRLQISGRYYKDVLKYSCGQYNLMVGCDSFISSPTGNLIIYSAK